MTGAAAPGLPWTWGDLAGTTDHFVDHGSGLRAARGLRVAAPPEVVWRWVCQLQVAPYSYDLVDNLGRRSPRTLTPGVGEFEEGARFSIFTVRAVDPGRSVELEITRPVAVRMFGRVLMAYQVVDLPGRAALRCDLLVPGASPGLGQSALMWGDLVMMRKQLHTWKSLAERHASAAG